MLTGSQIYLRARVRTGHLCDGEPFEVGRADVSCGGRLMGPRRNSPGAHIHKKIKRGILGEVRGREQVRYELENIIKGTKSR